MGGGGGGGRLALERRWRGRWSRRTWTPTNFIFSERNSPSPPQNPSIHWSHRDDFILDSVSNSSSVSFWFLNWRASMMSFLPRISNSEASQRISIGYSVENQKKRRKRKREWESEKKNRYEPSSVSSASSSSFFASSSSLSSSGRLLWNQADNKSRWSNLNWTAKEETLAVRAN